MVFFLTYLSENSCDYHLTEGKGNNLAMQDLLIQGLNKAASGKVLDLRAPLNFTFDNVYHVSTFWANNQEGYIISTPTTVTCTEEHFKSVINIANLTFDYLIGKNNAVSIGIPIKVDINSGTSNIDYVVILKDITYLDATYSKQTLITVSKSDRQNLTVILENAYFYSIGGVSTDIMVKILCDRIYIKNITLDSSFLPAAFYI